MWVVPELIANRLRLLFVGVVSLLGPTSAIAQDFTVHDSWLLEAVDGTFYENGIGAPTVAFDAQTDTWVMYFEARFSGDTKPGCPTEWGIGRATSDDGLNWVVDSEPVLEPVDNSYFGCVVAHPIVIYDGTTWHLWFKAHQESDACDAPPDSGVGDSLPAQPPWGCSIVTGVGYASSSDGIQFDVSEQPVVNVDSFGFPAVTKVDGTYHMLVAYSDAANDRYELWQSISLDNGVTWSVPSFVLGPGSATWIENEVYNPSLVCEDEGPYPYTLFLGGRDTEDFEILTAGFGRAFSTDSVNWFLSADNPLFMWIPAIEPDWRHWDAVRVGENYLVYFAQKDDSGRNRVGAAYTFPDQQIGFDETQVSNRVCSTTGGPGDTDNDTDTDDTDATSDGGNETGTPLSGRGPGTASGGCGCQPSSDDGGCGCAAPVGPIGLPMLPLMLMMIWRRRCDESPSE